jgi:hypothetical protein
MKKALYIITLLMLAACARYPKLPVDQFQKKLAETPDVQLLDVRTPAEFAEGHIPGAINIDWRDEDFLQLGEHVDLFVKGGFDKGSNSLIIDGTRFYCGTGLYWYPLRDNRDLRVHGLFAYDGGDNAIDFSAGITYQLNLKLF